MPDSIFNDDNFNTVLTGFDMLILRLHYAPELQNGMTRAEVARVLPAILARMKPKGQRTGVQITGGTPQIWVRAIEIALGPHGLPAQRAKAAQQALAIAQAQGWRDTRLAFSYFAIGRLNVGKDQQAAHDAFSEAAHIYRGLPGGEVHAAHVDMQLAAQALSAGDAKDALILADRAIAVVRRGENASLLATLMMVKAEALAMLGRDNEAKALRLDSLPWARYGFGSESAVRARMSDISSLVPLRFRNNHNG